MIAEREEFRFVVRFVLADGEAALGSGHLLRG
jgi:hypothetical protein